MAHMTARCLGEFLDLLRKCLWNIVYNVSVKKHRWINCFIGGHLWCPFSSDLRFCCFPMSADVNKLASQQNNGGVKLSIDRLAVSRSVRPRSVQVNAGPKLFNGKRVNKVVLAYSGGLDTSVILKWLQDTYDCEVVTFTADLGQVSFIF